MTDVHEENVIEPIQTESSLSLFQRWRDFLELKESILREWRLVLAARAVDRVSGDDQGGMERLAFRYAELVYESDHQDALDKNQEQGVVIASLGKIKEKFRKKSGVLIRANRKVRSLREEVQDQEKMLEFLLMKTSQTKLELIAEMKQHEADIAAANAVLAKAQDKLQAQIEPLERALGVK